MRWRTAIRTKSSWRPITRSCAETGAGRGVWICAGCCVWRRNEPSRTIRRFVSRTAFCRGSLSATSIWAGARKSLCSVQQAREGELRVLRAQGEVAFEPIARPTEKQRPAQPPRTRAARPPAGDHHWRRYPAVVKTVAGFPPFPPSLAIAHAIPPFPQP